MRIPVGSQMLTRLVHPIISSEDLANSELISKFFTTSSSSIFATPNQHLSSLAGQLHFSYFVHKLHLKQMMSQKLGNGVDLCSRALSSAGRIISFPFSTLPISCAIIVKSILTPSCWRSWQRSISFGKITVESSRFQYEVFYLRQRLMSQWSISKIVWYPQILLVLILSYSVASSLIPSLLPFDGTLLYLLPSLISPNLRPPSSGSSWEGYY